MLDLIREINSSRNTFKVEINRRLNDVFVEIEAYYWDDDWETWLEQPGSLSITYNTKNTLKITKEEL
ncbi:hypothetical protein [Sporosarcina sp. D27]|uniref:hypothetical protein n=1 Tax=Sporosarcina sp. D27 TaxID=1382305 RepID=UPI0004726F86|nr:hypothetical protein [Sporosarcina sp. D27]